MNGEQLPQTHSLEESVTTWKWVYAHACLNVAGLGVWSAISASKTLFPNDPLFWDENNTIPLTYAVFDCCFKLSSVDYYSALLVLILDILHNALNGPCPIIY